MPTAEQKQRGKKHDFNLRGKGVANPEASGIYVRKGDVLAQTKKGTVSPDPYKTGEESGADSAVDTGSQNSSGNTASEIDPIDLNKAEIERINAIAHMIGTIVDSGKSSDMTSDGGPKVRVLEKALGYSITEAERDIAWAQHIDILLKGSDS